jgi:hypothetical protein
MTHTDKITPAASQQSDSQSSIGGAATSCINNGEVLGTTKLKRKMEEI